MSTEFACLSGDRLSEPGFALNSGRKADRNVQLCRGASGLLRRWILVVQMGSANKLSRIPVHLNRDIRETASLIDADLTSR
jgi:hypothetical protein